MYQNCKRQWNQCRRGIECKKKNIYVYIYLFIYSFIYLSWFWDGSQSCFFFKNSAYILQNSCTASLNCLERSESCLCNPILSALCLSLVILAIFSNTEVYCEGKKGDTASLSPFLLCHRQQGVSQPDCRNSAYIPKGEELQLLCFESIFQTKERRDACHK